MANEMLEFDIFVNGLHYKDQNPATPEDAEIKKQFFNGLKQAFENHSLLEHATQHRFNQIDGMNAYTTHAIPQLPLSEFAPRSIIRKEEVLTSIAELNQYTDEQVEEMNRQMEEEHDRIEACYAGVDGRAYFDDYSEFPPGAEYW